METIKSKFPGSTHNHTDYSNFRFRDSIITVKELIDTAIALGHTVVGITEHETVASSLKIEKYYKKVMKENPDLDLTLIRGNEIYLCRDGLNAENFKRGIDRYFHFCVYALDEIGHEQVRELSTRAWSRSYVSYKIARTPTYYQDLFEIVGQNPGHIAGSTACLGGALPAQLMKLKTLQGVEKDELKAKILNWCYALENLFGKGLFFLELQPSKTEEQTYVNRELVELSKETSIPYIITTDSHYPTKEDRPIHRAYLKSQNGDREVDAFYATTYMMGTEELEDNLELTEEELAAGYASIRSLASKCKDFTLEKELKIPELPWIKTEPLTEEEEIYYFDKMPELKIFSSSCEGDIKLVEAVVAKLKRDKDLLTDEIFVEINACFEMTRVSSEKNNVHWSVYYLNLQKIIEECWKAGTFIGAGRGSGVGFIILYLLDIVQINPLWENTKTFRWRFLNPDRVSVLDVDIDIEGGKRKQVLNHLRKVYGADRVCNVATFGTEKSRKAIQTACRGLEIDTDVASYLSGMIKSDRGQMRTLHQTFYGDVEAGFDPNKEFVKEMTYKYPEVWEVAQRIEGLVCQLGEHAGGVIFVDEPFTKSTALMKAPNGDIMTQFDLHDSEDCS